ncbi:MAG: hypothetical protein ABI488_16005, partial [Polyangiaceae bacterium]
GAGGAGGAGDAPGGTDAGGAADTTTADGAAVAGFANEPAAPDPQSGGCALVRARSGVGVPARDATGLLALLAAIVASGRRRRATPP